MKLKKTNHSHHTIDTALPPTARLTQKKKKRDTTQNKINLIISQPQKARLRCTNHCGASNESLTQLINISQLTISSVMKAINYKAINLLNNNYFISST